MSERCNSRTPDALWHSDPCKGRRFTHGTAPVPSRGHAGADLLHWRVLHDDCLVRKVEHPDLHGSLPCAHLDHRPSARSPPRVPAPPGRSVLMARIRTVKPEMFESESLAECSVTAMLTFIGLLTQADDSGRHRDHPAIIAGRLWALRPEHTAAHVAQDLEELAAAGLICRYAGCDGRTWLHVVTWEQHQKINKPTASRVPRCPSHQGHQPCGKCQTGACPAKRTAPSVTSPGTLPEDSGSPLGGVHHPVATVTGPAEATADPGEPMSAPLTAPAAPIAAPSGKATGQTAFPKDSRRTTGGLPEGSRSGSRILDPGSFLTGREAPAPDPLPDRSPRRNWSPSTSGTARADRRRTSSGSWDARSRSCWTSASTLRTSVQRWSGCGPRVCTRACCRAW